MKAGGLMTRTRLRLGDMQGTRYSDYELLAAVGNAAKMLWIALAEHYSSIPRKSVALKLRNGFAPLPGDFYTLVGISGGARIEGMRVRGDGETVELTYNGVPKPLVDENSDVELPHSLTLDAVEVTAAILTGNIEGAAELANASAARIAQKREFARLPDWRHFS